MLGFDLATFIFQIANFVILLALLAKFFYRPVLDTMQRRQAEIDARLAEAEEQATAARDERERLAEQARAAAVEADRTLEEARAGAAREGQALLQQARTNASALVEEARKTVAAEEHNLLLRLQSRLSSSVVEVSGRVIRDAAGPEVHERLIAELARDGHLFPAVREPGAARGPVRVESAYTLTPECERQLRANIGASLDVEPDAMPIEFSVEPELLAGARVLVGTTVIDLSLRRLLEDLGRDAIELEAR